MKSSWLARSVCTYGGSCAGDTLGFNVSVGSGLTNKVYVYDNGLVSIGAPIVPVYDSGALVPITSLDQLAGQNVFSPFLEVTPLPDPPESSSPLRAAFVPHSGSNYDRVFGVYGADDVFDISFAEFQITPFAGANPGGFTLTFRYGDPALLPPDLSRGVLGYQFDGLAEQQSVEVDDDFVRNFDLGSPWL